jgi:homoserine kinase
MSLDLWNRFDLSLVPDQHKHISVVSRGEGAFTLPTGRTNPIARVLFEELEETLGQAPPGPLKIVCDNQIPSASGLGSSSTAVIAGLVFAHALGRRELTPENAHTIKRAILSRAVEIEGHGDNVVPALLGGLVVVTRSGTGRLITHRFSCRREKVVICVPDFHFLTPRARAVLPPALPRADAIYNVAHSVLTIEALRTGDLKLLGRVLDDVMHEPYRLPLIPGALDVRQAVLDHGGVGACLSGAGPGLLAFAGEGHNKIGDAMMACFKNAGLKSRYWVLNTSNAGAEIIVPKAV